MQIQYSTFKKWKNSFFVYDIIGSPLNKEQKKFTILGIIVEGDDKVLDIFKVIKIAIDNRVHGIIIDNRRLPPKLEYMIKAFLDAAGYVDTKSYEFRISYFKDWAHD